MGCDLIEGMDHMRVYVCVRGYKREPWILMFLTKLPAIFSSSKTSLSLSKTTFHLFPGLPPRTPKNHHPNTTNSPSFYYLNLPYNPLFMNTYLASLPHYFAYQKEEETRSQPPRCHPSPPPVYFFCCRCK